jgi:hypothetical protein
MSHTKVNGRFVIRLVIGQTYVKREDVMEAWEILNSEFTALKSNQ